MSVDLPPEVHAGTDSTSRTLTQKALPGSLSNFAWRLSQRLQTTRYKLGIDAANNLLGVFEKKCLQGGTWLD